MWTEKFQRYVYNCAWWTNNTNILSYIDTAGSLFWSTNSPSSLCCNILWCPVWSFFVKVLW